MRTKTLYLLITLILLASCLSACAKKPEFDSNLSGGWAVELGPNSSEKLFGILLFDQHGRLVQTDAFFLTTAVHQYVIVLPGYILIDPDEREQIEAKYAIRGDELTIQFEDGINVYTRLSQSEVEEIVTILSGVEPSKMPDPSPLAFDPNSAITTSEPTVYSYWESTKAPTSTPFIPTEPPRPVVSPTAKTYYPLSDCSPSQIHPGDSVYVNYDTGKMSMREEPTARIGDSLIRKLDEGEVLHIIDGPVCDMDWVFWKVRTVHSEKGWIPEGDGDEFWVLPLNIEHVCTGAKPTRLWVGARAFVEPKPDDHNRMYPEPKIDADNLIYRMKPGSYMQVLDGPACGTNREGVWWYVRSEDSGKEGWTRESSYQKDYYFIAPVIPRP